MKRWHILFTLFLLTGLANLIRAGMAVYIAPALDTLSLSLSLPLLAGLYLLFGLGFLAAAIVCWRRKGDCYAFRLALVYQTILWIIHIVGDRSAYTRSLWPRDAVLTLAFLVLVAVLTAGRKPPDRTARSGRENDGSQSLPALSKCRGTHSARR